MREKARIDEVVSEYVTLRSAGGGSLKGLCPFHDEKSPSFNVNPARRFLPLLRLPGRRRRHHLRDEDRRPDLRRGRRAARRQVRRPAALRGGRRPRAPAQRAPAAPADRGAQGRRRRSTSSSWPRPTRWPARQFLDERGFDQDAAEHVRRRLLAARRRGAAQAPAQQRLQRRGAGHGRPGRDGQPRALRPVPRPADVADPRRAAATPIGFGARRIFDDDRIEAKYLNTPETPIYKKSQVLYGIDLARRDIARALAGRGRRGLHRRDGLPPVRGDDRGRHLRHGVRRRPRPGPAPAAHTTTRSSAAR